MVAGRAKHGNWELGIENCESKAEESADETHSQFILRNSQLPLGLSMYEVTVQARFSAVHQVRMPDGELEPIHGHDWLVRAVFRGAGLDKHEFVVDFEAAGAALRKVLERLDHRNLNNVGLLAGHNPTAEVVARVIHEQLTAAMPTAPGPAAVYVEEAPGCVAGYIAEGVAGYLAEGS